MKSKRLFWQIVDKIELLIQSGKYLPGMRLPPERELAQNYSVSRPTIREAIIALEVRGKVEVKTGSGVYVLENAKKSNSELSINAFELTQARALIEGEIAALAATSITDTQLSDLKSTLDMMKDNIEVEEADKKFHHIIAKATKNSAMVISVRNLWNLRASTLDIINDYKNVCAEDNKKTLAEHTAIYNALKTRDSAAARSSMHQHFNRLINKLFDTVEAKALEEIHRKNNEKRGQYSISNLFP